MSSIDPTRLGFRPVTPDDFSLLEGWLKTPHWQEWWGKAWETELGHISDMIEGKDSTRLFLILLDGRAVGYIQSWIIADALCEPWLTEAPWLREVPTHSVGVDLSIGDAADLCKGIGSAALKAFVDLLLAEGHDCILIDPDAANGRAVRAYEKAGFRPLLVSPEPGGDGAQATLIMKFAATDAAPNDRTSA
ncbi:MAG: GNAT family N-acetyltransferase [Hoeflea sp.]|nr:GNAT family N-acetyltransferase [Hoeflea sp.]